MKKLLVVLLASCFVTTAAHAATQAKTAGTVKAAAVAAPVTPVAVTAPVVAELTLKGVIVDNMCAAAHKADLAEFIKTHPKSCALMAACVASGYSLESDGALMKFDSASNAKIAEFLKKEGSSLKVAVVAKKVGEELSLVSIVNQA